jgi:hypothetical protein
VENTTNNNRENRKEGNRNQEAGNNKTKENKEEGNKMRRETTRMGKTISRLLDGWKGRERVNVNIFHRSAVNVLAGP